MPKPKLFATIAGVKIYHVHKDGYGEGRELNFHYSTSNSSDPATLPDGLKCNEHDRYTFDVRTKLGHHPESYLEQYDLEWLDYFERDLKVKLRGAIESGRIDIPSKDGVAS